MSKRKSRGSRVAGFTSYVERHRLFSLCIIAGIVVGAVATFTDNLQKVARLLWREQALEITAVRVIDTDTGLARFRKEWLRPDSLTTDSSAFRFLPRPVAAQFPVLDIVVRNTSASAIVLTEFEVSAHRIAVEDSGLVNCSPIAPTWSYHVLLDENAQDQKKRIPLNQLVPANGADRFAIVIGHGDFPWYRSVYELRGTFSYNRGRRAMLGVDTVRVQGAPCGTGPRLPVPYQPRKG